VFLEHDTLSWDYLVLAMGSQTSYFSGFVAWLA
jgi:NADH dehydrogenase FAD-containing subunit